MPQLVQLAPQIVNGLYVYHLDGAATTNVTVVKNTPGQLYGWYINNTNAAFRYLCFHDIATTPLAGRGIYFKMGIPPTGAANILGEGYGIQFNQGISFSTVVNPIDSDSSAIAIHDLIINLFYR